MHFRFHLFTSDGPVVLDIPKPAYSKLTEGGASDGDAIAPMTGTITQVMVKAGDSVAAGLFFVFILVDVAIFR